jgi:cold shock CspA family protein
VTEPKFRVQRRRLGTIRWIDPQGKYGFIEAEDFRSDVFFHLSSWERLGPRTAPPAVGQFVEFEIDEAYRDTEGRLRASSLRETNRPQGAAMTGEEDPHLRAQHHPKARRKKPSWRKKTP